MEIKYDAKSRNTQKNWENWMNNKLRHFKKLRKTTEICVSRMFDQPSEKKILCIVMKKWESGAKMQKESVRMNNKLKII